jgi:hypothetical protein
MISGFATGVAISAMLQSPRLAGVRVMRSAMVAD